ncbi:hypothetical protein EVAR_49070_1 [Eumeta japonica]|uniref:Uncharacterized protein n=1 Tax=Eumeta variegata TaxID=151549 RepID=A0A4C2AEL3_EUMVA|nr:hypothetical protein EVAR_49070_1 [Eumeta japonica]
MGPPDGGRPIPIRKITNWKECALTNHVRTVVEESEREVPASSDRRKFPPDILELIRAKTQLCAARAYPTPEYRSRARALQREVKARVREFRNESWSDLMEKSNHPTKLAIDDAEIAECLADSIETQCSHASPPHDIAHISRIEEEVLQNLPRTQRRSGSRLTQRSPNASEIT